MKRIFPLKTLNTHIVHLECANADVRFSPVLVSAKIEKKFPSGEISVSDVRVLVLILPPRECFLQAFLTLDILPRTREHGCIFPQNSLFLREKPNIKSLNTRLTCRD